MTCFRNYAKQESGDILDVIALIGQSKRTKGAIEMSEQNGRQLAQLIFSKKDEILKDLGVSLALRLSQPKTSF